MKRILVISLNSGGTMGHGKILSSLANFLSQKGKQIMILSDMPFSRNFDLDKKVKLSNLRKVPHINYTIGGMCNCSQKEKIHKFAINNNIECVIFSTFFDPELVKKFKDNKIKTILLSYPIRDTYRLALKQKGIYAIFDRVITLYGPEFKDKMMPNETLANPLKIVKKEINNIVRNDILVTCGGGGRPSSKIFLKKISSALGKIIGRDESLKITVIKGNSKSNMPHKDIKMLIWTKNFGSLISSSKIVISEAGYFTMLDLINYKKKALLIPGERIIDNQEIRALKLEDHGIAKIFFPFEKTSKLFWMIKEALDKENDNEQHFQNILKKFNRYRELGEILLGELK